MPAKGRFIKGCKERGEWAELCFMARAVQHGFNVSRPYGDTGAYDVGVEHNGRFSRVQVKSVTFFSEKSYTCNICSSRGTYNRGHFEFFAIYLVPLDLWYVIPFDVVRSSPSLHLGPNARSVRFARYMEAWHLMSGKANFRKDQKRHLTARLKAPSHVRGRR